MEVIFLAQVNFLLSYPEDKNRYIYLILLSVSHSQKMLKVLNICHTVK